MSFSLELFEKDHLFEGSVGLRGLRWKEAKTLWIVEGGLVVAIEVKGEFRQRGLK